MANRVYYLDRSGATPQVRIANDRQKVKKYASIVDAQTDLANIGTGEIVATEDGDLNLVNAWIGTQAQYDALTDIPEDTVCFIIDNGSNEYSTDETVTDKTWIDGKPIYRRVFEVLKNGVLDSNWTRNGAEFTYTPGFDIDTLIDNKALTVGETASNYCIISSYYGGVSGSTYPAGIYFQSANDTFVVRNRENATFVGTELTLIIEYTKEN